MEPIFLRTCVGFRFDTCGSLVKVVEAVRTFAPEAGCSAACSGFTCFMHCETTQDDKDEKSNIEQLQSCKLSLFAKFTFFYMQEMSGNC